MRTLLAILLDGAASLGCASSQGSVAADDAATDGASDGAMGDGAIGDGVSDGADAVADVGPCDGAPTYATLQRLAPAPLEALIQAESPIIIDVHVPYAGKLPGTAADIPYTNVDAIETFLGHDHCADVVLTCLSGGMSLSAGDALVARGYLRVHDLLGGMTAWQAAGYPIQQ